MKTLCVRGDTRVTAGVEYVVLGIYGCDATMQCRIIRDKNKTLALHKSDSCELIDSKIPDGWVLKVYSVCEWESTPGLWAIPGFWKDYYDEADSAVLAFTYVTNVVLEQSACNQ